MPSGLTATEFGPSRPIAGAQPFAALAAMQPAAPLRCFSLPVLALRAKIAIASLFDEAT